jgi:protein required for attachment to host cells
MFHVIVADSQTVRVFETNSTGSTLDELLVFRNEAAHQHERDLVTARPGRVVNRAAGVPQSFDPKVSAKRILTQRWLKGVGTQLQSFLASRRSEAAILVAAPRMLADLRRHLPNRVRALIRAELARDLMHQPVIVLRKRVQSAVRTAARSTLKFQPVYRGSPGRSSRPRIAALPA